MIQTGGKRRRVLEAGQAATGNHVICGSGASTCSKELV